MYILGYFCGRNTIDGMMNSMEQLFYCVDQEYVERFVARFWATLSDLRWGHPKWWFSKESVPPKIPNQFRLLGIVSEFAEMVGKSTRISVQMGIQLSLEVQD